MGHCQSVHTDDENKIWGRVFHVSSESVLSETSFVWISTGTKSEWKNVSVWRMVTRLKACGRSWFVWHTHTHTFVPIRRNMDPNKWVVNPTTRTHRNFCCIDVDIETKPLTHSHIHTNMDESCPQPRNFKSRGNTIGWTQKTEKTIAVPHPHRQTPQWRCFCTQENFSVTDGRYLQTPTIKLLYVRLLHPQSRDQDPDVDVVPTFGNRFPQLLNPNQVYFYLRNLIAHSTCVSTDQQRSTVGSRVKVHIWSGLIWFERRIWQGGTLDRETDDSPWSDRSP